MYGLLSCDFEIPLILNPKCDIREKFRTESKLACNFSWSFVFHVASQVKKNSAKIPQNRICFWSPALQDCLFCYLPYSVGLSHNETYKESHGFRFTFQLNYFVVFVFLKAMIMLGFDNVRRVKKIMDASGYSEDV